MKPQFYILAGPNGAGKSTHSIDFIPKETFYFNGDEVYAALLLQHPEYDPEKLKGGVPYLLEKKRDEAISELKDFAFESNFSNDMAVHLTNRFREAGYQTNLIYFGLNDIETAAMRVDSRVAMGKHNIGNEDIKFNYAEGIKKVNENFSLFDVIRFVDTGIVGTARTIAFYINSTAALRVLSPNINWFDRHFKENIQKHAEKSSLQLTSDKSKKEKKNISTGFRRKR